MAGRRIEIRGTVQGVGFRPWVHGVARCAGVTGRVRNDPRGVTIEAFADEDVLEGFLEQLRAGAPPPARVVELRSTPIPEVELDDFVIESSGATGDKALSISPDLATCTECEAEVLDPSNRRYGYAFTNCTRCGPRFTIATGIPYDRAATTMSAFEMCPACRREYDDVEDRRFHAQPNACPECGPSLSLVGLGGDLDPATDPVGATADLLKRGAVVAIKGLGGFHLACDANDAAAVQLLRERKHRDEKPFAVMTGDLDAARQLAELTPEEEVLLTAPERPVVLVRARPETGLARDVSLESPLLGLFLPYTPLHHLLLAAVDGPLVMTSANVSDEPICRDNDEAERRLTGIADAILLHDRDIAMRCDDSVVRVIAGTPTIIRRSRGFVPRPFQLARPVAQPVLACGAHLKNTFCIASGDTAYFGPHIGDLETVAALDFFEEAIDRMQTILGVRPQVVAHDLHPGYMSTRYAKALADSVQVGVQHHHAHVASVMAEHRVCGPVLGVAYDGTGFGDDGTSWGGEFLLCFPNRFERLATFRPVRLPGGDRAMREVWRIAYAMLHDAFDGSPQIDSLPLFRGIAPESIRIVSQMIERDLNAPRARGVGRYFDGFGSLALGRPVSTYEGQVAIAWDHMASDEACDPYPFALDRSTSPMEVDLRPAVRAAFEEVVSGMSPAHVSARFHNTVVTVTVEVLEALLAELGRLPVALTGGVFHNERLAAGVAENLRNDIRVLRHGQVPPGDGGIALGQALIADAFLGDKG
ncbi:MAG: carbamoyltransferase HypF [Deltaproteobacteria bacterium]|nr:carbamoyltransferase HypF [Deltaproteobacteria bacterium]MBW1874133.1 carbamoyltransferase HypF [Deltaproteobacteria bacterium]MBW2209705.1 carbamoyltransferase HypF [Deltaproteobacteria bacterium]MBW2212881.1 carbamoyltransferase HypF [Deltaproteobacteria bacterium]MBW2378267.1 carbamoyltransferase HypF [Deltaproteobacteria bacterium]